MASPEILDFERLLAPIAGENPAGSNLREDHSPSSLYHAVKLARTEARDAERKLASGEATTAPDWKPILQSTAEAIAGQSKDLELAAWLTEALVRVNGFAGLRDGFRLMRELVEKFWDTVYPLPDAEGVGIRVAPIGGLNATLDGPIRSVSLTEEVDGAGPFARWHYQQAGDMEAVTDPERREKRIAAGAVTSETISHVEGGTSAEFFQRTYDDVVACLGELEALCALLEEKCGADDSGESLAPPSSRIRDILRECQAILGDHVKTETAPVDGEGPGAEAGAETGADRPEQERTVAAPGAIRNREEAFKALLKVAQFFKETEPHSPVSYALERAVRWGKMELPQLLSELIQEEGSRSSVFKLVGIPDPEGTGGSEG